MDFQMRGETGPDLLQTICFDLPISPVIPSAGKASSTPCSPKAEEAGGLHYPPPPLLTAHLSPFLYTHTHTFNIHTHTGLSFESLGLDLKFLFRACHAFYMHGEWERRGGIAWGSSPNELPSAVGLLRDVSTHTHTHHFLSLPSFSRTHSTLSTLVLLHHAFHKFHRAARVP